MASSSEQETRLCGNCKRDIPVINFTIHEIHCQRNISICKICKEPFPTSDMEEHIATEHVLVTCKCKMTMEKNLLEEHERSSCPLRLIKCQFCDLELACRALGEHEEYCGARTQCCEKCGSSVLTKDLKDHPTVCGKVTEPKKPARAESYRPPEYEGTWFDSLQYKNTFTDDMFSRMPKHVPRRFYGRSVLTKSLKTSNEEVERNKRRAQNREIPWTDDIDNMPADLVELEDAIGVPEIQPMTNQNNAGLSPESEISFPRRDPAYWRNLYPADNVQRTSVHERNNTRSDDSAQLSVPTSPSSEVTQLPCEFCEELFPLEDLLLHQSGCQLHGVSSNRRSSSPRESRRSSSPPVHSSQMVLLPCEFCGVLLEGDILFHHQDQCEKCPDSGKSSPHTPEPLSDDVSREEKLHRTYEAPATVRSQHSPTTGVNRYLKRETVARPPRPTRTTLLAENRYRQPRMNNTLLNPALEETRKQNIEENMRLFRNQRHDNLPTRGASNRNNGPRNKVTNQKTNPEDVDKEE